MLLSEFPFVLFFVAIIIAFLASASGFSGAVFFQPFFYFLTDVPLKESISTGIATETVGMSSGALGYWRHKKINFQIIKEKLLWVIVGIVLGFILLKFVSRGHLRFIVGISMILAGIIKIWSINSKRKIVKKKTSGLVSMIAGIFSASTGTGNAEIHQPLLEIKEGLETRESNATAIGLEAIGNIIITTLNLVINDLRFDILQYTIPGVIIGSQLGVWYGMKASNKILLYLFSFAVIWIGIIYIFF